MAEEFRNKLPKIRRSEKLLIFIYDCWSPDIPVWTPSIEHRYSRSLNEQIWVSGAGDRAALDSLRRRGLLDKFGASEFYELTEHGQKAAREAIERVQGVAP